MPTINRRVRFEILLVGVAEPVAGPNRQVSGATAISAVAVAHGDVPIKLVLVNPSGLTVQSVDSVNGVAVLTAPVSAPEGYTVKVINVSPGPVQVWTAGTPTMTR